MKKHIRICAAVTTIFTTTAVQAAGIVAELHMIKGKVLVNQGNGYVSVAGVNAGDQILVGAKSEAVLMYPNGCDVTIRANQIYSVPADAPCQQRVARVEAPGDIYGSVAQPVAPIEPAFDSTMLLVGGGVLLAGGAAALLLIKKSASP